MTKQKMEMESPMQTPRNGENPSKYGGCTPSAEINCRHGCQDWWTKRQPGSACTPMPPLVPSFLAAGTKDRRSPFGAYKEMAYARPGVVGRRL
jgi:hypothetical protein